MKDASNEEMVWLEQSGLINEAEKKAALFPARLF